MRFKPMVNPENMMQDWNLNHNPSSISNGELQFGVLIEPWITVWDTDWARGTGWLKDQGLLSDQVYEDE